MSDRVRGLALLAMFSVSCGTLLACDGYLGVEGDVYQWADPSVEARSIALVDPGERAVAPRGAPLPGCAVSLEPWSPDERPTPDLVTLWRSTGITDASGHFKVGGTAAPGRYESTLAVECPGFARVEQVFTHDRFWHVAVVTLVRDSEQHEQPHD